MSDSIVVNSISQVHHALGLPKPLHPLVTLVKPRDYETVAGFKGVKVVVNLYQIQLKLEGCGDIRYGRNSYDYEEGTLLFFAPGQVIEYQEDFDPENVNEQEWTLAFHPDLIRKSSLGKKIGTYSFFSYDANEALHLSAEEREMIENLVAKAAKEYSQNLDRHSQNLIISNIEMLLDYCLRFYDRQFYTRTNLNGDLISRFERKLKAYYASDKAHSLGLPNVSFMASELNLSPNYLSDLLKKETGKTAKEHIYLYIIDQAKTSLLNSQASISEIAYELGFEYPQHFSNMFKSKTGFSPREYRNLN